MKITSLSNDLIKVTSKLLQRKYRDQEGLFILEGEKCINEAIASKLEIINIFELENCNLFSNAIEVTEHIMSKITTTSTPPKVVAVARQRNLKWSNSYKKVLLLEDIKDAGNLGTILRSAAAFNVDAVVLYGNTVDLYNPKCVRSSVGNLWKVPVFQISDFEDLKLKFDSYERIATLPKAENTVCLNQYSPEENVLIMFGTESCGLSDSLKSFATKNVTIEMNKNVESLNLSISVGVFLYKISV